MTIRGRLESGEQHESAKGNGLRGRFPGRHVARWSARENKVIVSESDPPLFGARPLHQADTVLERRTIRRTRAVSFATESPARFVPFAAALGGRHFISLARGFAMKDTMISTGEAAALLGVDRRTIRRMVHDRRLRSYPTPSGQHRFRRADVEALVRCNNPESAPAGGPSPILKAMREDVELLKLKAEKLQAEERVAEIERTHAEKETERQAAAEAERQAQAEQRAQARREEEEQDRQRELREWRASTIEFLAPVFIPDGAPTLLVGQFYQKLQQSLSQFDGVQPQPVMDSLFAGAAQEVFEPWEHERQAELRAEWLKKETDEAWRSLHMACRAELDRARLDELEGTLVAALREAVENKMRGIPTPANFCGSVYGLDYYEEREQARKRAVAEVLAHYRNEKQQTTQAPLQPIGPRLDDRSSQNAVESALHDLRPYLAELREEGWLRVEPQFLDIFVRELEPRVRAFLEEQARKRGQLTAAEARQLLRDFVLEDQRLL